MHEEDHFISLELGGNPRDAKNLWPERGEHRERRLPHVDISAVARQRQGPKDKTETALNTAVCNATMTLQEAQHIIKTDWFKYYRDQALREARLCMQTQSLTLPPTDFLPRPCERT